jgi:hypothetical protein|tara:strand:- start:57 stop:263 length:207 start_codon:yes stop_codon:yes gene_type:complete
MENHLYRMHHKIKLQLDAICQEAGDMNVEEFMQVYEFLKQKVSKPKLTGIDRNFQEAMINDMDMGESV